MKTDGLFHFPAATRHDAGVAAWMEAHSGELGDIARRWFDVMRGCDGDVRELLHDGHPTACAGDAAFGFFKGSELPDPAGLLQGAGKSMRHVKLRPGEPVDENALRALIAAAWTDMCSRL